MTVRVFLSIRITKLLDYQSTSCCGTMKVVHATEGMLNTLNFNEKKTIEVNRFTLKESKSHVCLSFEANANS